MSVTTKRIATMNAASARRHRVWAAAAGVILLAATAGCTPFRPGLPSEPVGAGSSPIASQGPGAMLAAEARAQIGVPYRYGGTEPGRGFDCSGLVSYVHSREGITVPRTAAQQFAAARMVPEDDLRPGDLVFFRLVPGRREVTHVGIYTGQGRFVHAPQTGRDVVEARLDDPYFRSRYAGSGRFHDDPAGSGPRLKSSP
jgi:murein DD-endopeptidase